MNHNLIGNSNQYLPNFCDILLHFPVCPRLIFVIKQFTLHCSYSGLIRTLKLQTLVTKLTCSQFVLLLLVLRQHVTVVCHTVKYEKQQETAVTAVFLALNIQRFGFYGFHCTPRLIYLPPNPFFAHLTSNTIVF